MGKLKIILENSNETFQKKTMSVKKLGENYDNILYMNVHGSKIEVGFFWSSWKCVNYQTFKITI